MYTHSVDAYLHLYNLEKIGLYNISILIEMKIYADP